MNLKTTSNFHYLTYCNCFLKHIKQPLKISYISFIDKNSFLFNYYFYSIKHEKIRKIIHEDIQSPDKHSFR